MASFWKDRKRNSGYILGSGIAVTSLALFSGCAEKPATSAEYLNRAQASYLQQDFQTSFIEAKNALQQDPRNGQARYLLGQIYLEGGRALEAVTQLERARQLGVPDVTVLIPIARAYLFSNQAEKLLALRSTDNAIPKEDVAHLLALKGFAHILNKDTEAAEQSLNSALNLRPNFSVALVGKARLALSQRNLTEAEKWASEATSVSENDPDLHDLNGEIARLRGNLTRAEVSFTKALTAKPNLYQTRAKRALVRVAQNDIQGAKEDLAKLATVADRPFAAHAQGVYQLAIGQFDEAQTSFDNAFRDNNNSTQALYLKGITFYKLKNYEQARHFLERLISRHPSALSARKLLANVYMQAGEIENAQALLGPFSAALGDDLEVQALMAQVSLGQGKLTDTLSYLDRIKALRPNDPSIPIGLGLNKIQAGDISGGIENFNTAVELDNDFPLAKGLLALAYLRSGDKEKATETAKSMIAENPKDAMGLTLMGYLNQLEGKAGLGDKYFKEALVYTPGHPAASHNLALRALEDEDNDAARQLYEQALHIYPDNALTLTNLAKLENLEGRPREATRLLKLALQHNPDNSSIYILLAKDHIKNNNAGTARTLLLEAPEKIRDNPAVLQTRVKAELANGETTRALSTLGKLTQKYPQLSAAWLQLAELQLKQGLKTAAGKSLIATAKTNPKSITMRIEIVRRLVNSNHERQAKALFEKLQGENPLDPNIRLLSGWMEQRGGRHSEAVKIYAGLYKEIPSTETVMALVGAQKTLKQSELAIKTLQAWLKQNPRDQRANIGLTQLLLENGEPRLAAETMQKLAKYRPKDAKLHHDTSLIWEPIDKGMAIRSARRATELEPNNSEMMGNLGRLMTRDNNFEKGILILRKALGLNERNHVARLALASALAQKGNENQAASELRKIIVTSENPNHRAEAQRTLDSLFQLGSKLKKIEP